ncbi:MAG TPA: DUF4010 domain-containing protein [Acidimicrobiia bacterium]|nr:DUF4010 domain-containing protein [Acidimicrobiia bacterium]
MDDADLIIRLGLALALGALIGLERQVGRDPEDHGLAGMRTFALYGLWGAAAAFVGDEFGVAAFAVAAAAFGGLLLIEYWALARGGDLGTTTEAAAFATFVCGVLVWHERAVPAVALAVVVAALLHSKAWLHRVVARFSDEDLAAALRFGVLTAVILPLVPDRKLGPFTAINPFEIWLMVVFVAGIGLAGYIALRALGPKGLAPTGLLGGLVSSTAVTLGFSRMSKRVPEVTDALAAGVLAACGLMYGRVLIEALVIEPSVATRVVVPLVILFGFVEGAAAWWWWHSRRRHAESGLAVRNPVTIVSALQFGAIYGMVAFAAAVLVDKVSAASLSLVGAVSGINDVDAITLAASNLVRDGVVEPSAGAQAVLAAVAVNTVVKGGLAVVLGSRALGWRVAPILGVAALGAGVAWALV